jgi:hypothetical protein
VIEGPRLTPAEALARVLAKAGDPAHGPGEARVITVTGRLTIRVTDPLTIRVTER